VAKKDKQKTKRLGFLKKQKEKRDKKKRQRREQMKKTISPLKHLKNLSSDKIKEYLEDSPYLQQEPEIGELRFSSENVVNLTKKNLEKYATKFEEASSKKSQTKRELYEDFCVETVGKIVGKPFVIALKRRLRAVAKRLRKEGNNEQMMRAIVSEAMLDIPQIPVEAHPLIVGIYEDIRKEAMGDEFTFEGFENIIYWKDRVASEREEERTVSLAIADRQKVIDSLNGNDGFKDVSTAEETLFQWIGSSGEEEEILTKGTVTLTDDTLTLKTETPSAAQDARELFEEILGDAVKEMEPPDEEPVEDTKAEVSDSDATEEKKDEPAETPPPKDDDKEVTDKG